MSSINGERMTPIFQKKNFGTIVKQFLSAPNKKTFPKSLVNTLKHIHKNRVHKIKLAPDLKRMVSAGRDKSISVFDYDKNKPLRLKVPD